MNEQKSKLVRKWSMHNMKDARQVRKVIKAMNVKERSALYAKMRDENKRHSPEAIGE